MTRVVACDHATREAEEWGSPFQMPYGLPWPTGGGQAVVALGDNFVAWTNIAGHMLPHGPHG